MLLWRSCNHVRINHLFAYLGGGGGGYKYYLLPQKHGMKRPLTMSILERLFHREQEYLAVREKTEAANKVGLKYGVSFYGPIRLIASDVVKYKRIEVWLPRAPTKSELIMLRDYFKKNIPLKNNTCYAFYFGKLTTIPT